MSSRRLAPIFWHPRERRLRAGWRCVATIAAAVGLAIALAQFLAPLIGGTWAANIGGLVGFTLVTILAARYVDYRPIRDLGLSPSRGWIADLIFGLVLGLLLPVGILELGKAVGFYEVVPRSMTTEPGTLRAIAKSALEFVAVGFYEEILVRGYFLRNVAEGVNWQSNSARWAVFAAWVITSIAFAGGHAGNNNATAWSTVALIAAGLFAGLGRITTGSLTIPVGIHIAWNFAESTLGLPVSGVVESARLFDVHVHGPVAWTGGAFGPEGGALGLLAYFTGCAAILLWIRIRSGSVQVIRSLAVYRPRCGHAGAGMTPESG